MKYILLLTSYFIFLAACPLFAQQVQGVVIDGADGQPLPGVSVTVKGAAAAAMTDIDGHYAITAPADAVLRFTYIGMKPVEAPVAGRTAVNVQMEQDALQLDDVMVVAYGTSTRKSLTGAVAIVKSDQIGKIQAASVTKALEGLVPGLQTAGGNGQPGSGLSVRIRGFGSINASSAPLYVVDGMVYDGYISALNPDDIESMSVLKDASSAALYGSRAANGVIMVTTKKGREGKMKVNVKATAGMVVRAIDEYSRVNSKDYYELIWESWRNALVAQGNTPSAAAGIASGTTIDGVYEKLGKYNSLGVPVAEMFTADGKVNPAATVLWEDNWQDELFRTARRQEVQASASGANDKTDYFFSFGYLDEQGIVKSSDFSRLSARVSVNSEVAKWLKLGTNFSGSLQKTANLESASAATTNPFYYSRMMAPIYPIWIRDEATGAFIADPYSGADRLYDYGGSAHNTVIDPATGKAIWGDKQRAYAPNSNLASTIVLDRQSVSSDNLSNRSYAEIAFLRDFTFRVNGSIDLVSEYATDYQNRLYGDAYSVNGRSTKSYGRLLSVTWNQLLSWKREFGAHHLDVLAGHESYSYDAQSMYATRTGFGIYTTELAAGAVGEGSSSGSDAYRLESYLSRLNYDYENRYYFSASFRRDGSSRFHPSSRWGNFWSVAAAWNISQEAFLSGHDWIDHLKLKLSYGGQGNDDIGTFYAWQQLYTIAGYDNGSANGAFLASLENKDLQWEVNNNLNIGAEFKLFNRLSGEINWFNRMSDNLLFLVPNPQSTGIGATYRNVGAMRNRGIEIQIAGDVIKTADFLWNVDFNLTHISNKITKLPQKEIISGAHKLTEGHSLYDYWLRESAGVDPATGDQLYYMDTQDGNGNTVRTTTNDHNRATYYYVGTAIADAYGGLTNTFTYKNLELSVLCTYSIGGQAFDNVYASLMHNGAFGTAFHTDALNRWQQPGDVTDVPRLQSGKASQTAASSRYLIDASYLTVKNVTLNYMLPKQWVRKLRMENVRLFLSADNLYIESARKGLNPQQSFSGITDFGYVPTATYTLGLSFNF